MSLFDCLAIGGILVFAPIGMCLATAFAVMEQRYYGEEYDGWGAVLNLMLHSLLGGLCGVVVGAFWIFVLPVAVVVTCVAFGTRYAMRQLNKYEIKRKEPEPDA